MKRVTVDDVMKWKPCKEYSRNKVEELFAGRESLSWRNVLALDIPRVEMLWALLHSEFLSDRRLHLLACDFAERVLKLVPFTSREDAGDAIQVKRLWANGKVTDRDLIKAKEALASNTENLLMAWWVVFDAVLDFRAGLAAESARIARETAAYLVWDEKNAEAFDDEIRTQLELVIAAFEAEELEVESTNVNKGAK